MFFSGVNLFIPPWGDDVWCSAWHSVVIEHNAESPNRKIDATIVSALDVQVFPNPNPLQMGEQREGHNADLQNVSFGCGQYTTLPVQVCIRIKLISINTKPT
jgi:hypothetical protein